MQMLSDGSLLVGSSVPSAGGNFFNSTGQLLRLTDTNSDGVADAAPQVLATNLPAGITSVRRVGQLVFVTSAAADAITVLRSGAIPSDAITTVGSIQFTFPSDMEHRTYGLAVRSAGPSTHEVLFNLGSRYNEINDAATVAASGLIGGALAPESIYSMMVQDSGTSVTISNVHQIASGLRNSVGIVFAPNGDLYFQDNGIDGSPDPNEPLSADELNRIQAAGVGGSVEGFGFASTYQQYRTGVNVGSTGIAPLVTFQPIPMPDGSESEGPNEIALAPAIFPQGLNGGLFVGFHGRFNLGGLANEENPLVYADPSTGEYFHFIPNDIDVIGHPDGLMTTADSLFVSDLSSGSMFTANATGKIYQIKYLPEPGRLVLLMPAFLIFARRGGSRAKARRPANTRLPPHAP